MNDSNYWDRVLVNVSIACWLIACLVFDKGLEIRKREIAE